MSGLDERLSALLDGALAPEEAAALRAEIADSPALGEQLAALAAVDEDLRALPSPSVPPALRARVVRALRDAASAPRAAPLRWRRWLGAGALAAAAAMLALVLLSGGDAELEPAPLAEQPPAPAEALEPRSPVAPAEDLPVIEVLDLLAELDELEENGQG